jgi:hypothetical protein
MRFFMVAIAFLMFASSAEARNHHRHDHHQRLVVPHHHSSHRHYSNHEVAHASPGIDGLVGGLASKAMEIVGNCASRIVSTVRPGAYVAGTGRPSLHRDGRAVDIQGDPVCIYAHLRGWPGGYSTDASVVNHVHISYNPGGREWGARFVHGGHRRYRVRYAGV